MEGRSGVAQRRFVEQDVGNLVEDAPCCGQCEPTGGQIGHRQSGVGGYPPGERRPVGPRAEYQAESVGGLELDLAECAEPRPRLGAGKDDRRRPRSVVVRGRRHGPGQIGSAVLRFGPERQTDPAGHGQLDFRARLAESVVPIEPKRTEVLILSGPARCHAPRKAQRPEDVEPRERDEVGACVGTVDARVGGIVEPDANQVRLEHRERLDATVVTVGPFKAAAEIRAPGDTVELVPPPVHPHQNVGVGVRPRHARAMRLRCVEVQASREPADRCCDFELALKRLVHSLKVDDRGEGVAVFGSEAARRKVDALEHERVEAALRKGVISVQAKRGNHRGTVQQHPGLGDVSASHEEPRSVAETLDAGKGLDRPKRVGSGTRRAHHIEVVQGDVRQVAQPKGASLDAYGFECDRSQLHHDRDWTVDWERDRAANLEVADPLGDEGDRSSRRGAEGEGACGVGGRAFECFQEKDVGSAQRLA